MSDKPESKAGNSPTPLSLAELHDAHRSAPSEDERMSDGTIHWKACNVADGTATPDEARELLVEFSRQANEGRISPRMLEHMGACVESFLVGRKTLLPAPRENRQTVIGVPTATLEKAFGLVRVAPGNPRIDDDTLAEVAMEVLERLLDGKSLEVAAEEVAADRKERRARVSSESQVRAAWAGFKSDGLTNLRIARLGDVGEPGGWTPEEMERLTQRFWGEIWFCPPGVDIKARQDAILAEVDRPGTDANDIRQRVKAVIAKIDGPRPPKIRRNTSA